VAQVRRLPVVFHVAAVGGEPIFDTEEVTSWLAVANGHFADADVRFETDAVRVLPAGRAVLRNIRERRSLARFLRPRRVNVFIVEAILDPWPSAATVRAAAAQGFEPSGRLGGAHILVSGRTPETYIIVRRGSGPLTLTHELGHFLSAPHHRDPANIMSYGRHRTHFDERQIRAFRYRARRYQREGTLPRRQGPQGSQAPTST
ncbi:MAG: hypothetical protein JRH11_27050, partial [Deltaproteobacteria bacterium]|nr:hypothetical protein [Deltaproteobacteria bacterium]